MHTGTDTIGEVYPHDAQGRPIDTPDWRDATNIQKEASAVDSPLIKAVRKHEKEPELLDAALAAPDCDVNAVDKYGMAALHLALKAKLPKVTSAVAPAAPRRARAPHLQPRLARRIEPCASVWHRSRWLSSTRANATSTSSRAAASRR